MAKGKFRSNDYTFRQTAMGAALQALGVVEKTSLVREGKMEVIHPGGQSNVINRRAALEELRARKRAA